VTTYLDEILDRKRTELKERVAHQDISALTQTLTPCTTDVLGALRQPDRITVIAEHKRRSPSKGVIRANSNPADIAQGYARAGAAAISVLTDEVGFGGTSDDLRAIRDAVSIPILRKDFLLYPLQIMEARAWGADMVLLIVAALTPKELRGLHQMATRLGMTPLVEVHDEHELHVALDSGARLIGVNNRNLHTFTVDLDTSISLARKMPDDVVRVSESGIRNHSDLLRMKEAGYDAVLVGEQLMQHSEPEQALRELLG